MAFDGLGVSPGIAIGPAYRGRDAAPCRCREYAIADGDVEAERERFAERASARPCASSRSCKAKAQALPRFGGRGDRVSARRASADAVELAPGARRRPAHRRATASTPKRAVQAEIEAIAAELRRDERHLSRGARRRRARGRRPADPQPDEDAVPGLHAAARGLASSSPRRSRPADTALIDPRRIGGFATVLGGAESHTAIMARSLGLPAVLGVAGLLGAVRPGDAGDRRRRRRPRHRQPDRRRRSTAYRRASGGAGPRAAPARRACATCRRVTRDGVEIALAGQSRTAARARSARCAVGADGRRPAAHRVPVHEPRRPARARTSSTRCSAEHRAGHGRRGRSPIRTLDVGGDKIAVAARRPFTPGRQPGAGPARHPAVAARSRSCSRRSSPRSCAPARTGRCASCCR